MKKILIVLLVLTSANWLYAQKNNAETSKNKTVSEKKLKQKLTGTWFLVSVAFISPDGKRTQPYGENPSGILAFINDGNYSLQILRTDRSKLASGDKSKGTDDENKALVLGSNSHFGKYSLNAADNTITFQIEHAFFPNWEGTEQKSVFELEGSRLKLNTPTTTSGGRGEVVWKRVD